MLRKFRKIVSILVGTQFLLLASANGSFAAAEDPKEAQLLAQISACPAILGRMQRDHSVTDALEEWNGDKAVHVYATTTDFDAPFSFSLGWFVMVTSGGAEVCADEFGQKIPLPGTNAHRLPGIPHMSGVPHIPGVRLHKSANIDETDLQIAQGFDYISDGNLKNALGEFEAAVKESPDNAKAHNNLGACLAAMGNYPRAQTELKLALKQKDDYAIALANQAWLSLMMHKPEQALEEANKALGFQKMLKPAILAFGRAYLDLGKNDEAKTLAERAYAKWPDDLQVCILAGDANVSAGDLRTAHSRFQKALVFGPNNPKVLLKLAAIAEKLGDLDDAIRKARTATKANPKDLASHLALGHYLELNRDLKGAQIQYQIALDNRLTLPQKQGIYGPYLRVLMLAKKESEADKQSLKWVKENPGDADCHYNRAWVISQLPDPSGKLDHKSTAIAEYRKAVELNPSLIQAHYNLGILLAGLGKKEEASTELKDFIDKAPQDPDVASAQQLLTKLGQ